MFGFIGSIISLGLSVWGWLRGSKDKKIGQLEEKTAEQAKITKDVETANEVESSVAREPDPAERLREQWSRD